MKILREFAPGERLMLALSGEKPRKLIANLLIMSGEPLNYQDKRGETPLHKAVKRNCKETARLLVEYGANTNAKDNRGNTPKFYADCEGKEYFIELLHPHNLQRTVRK